MEPVRRSIQAPVRRKTVLLVAVAAILLLLGGVLWFGKSRELARTPITAAELDHQLMESGREEFLPLPAPTPAEGKLREAQMALANRLPEEALKLANELLANDTNNAVAYIVRGRAYSRKGDHGKAAESYARAIELKPNLPEPYLYRGHLHKAAKKYDQALEQYNEALERNPEMVAAYYHRGDIYLLKGEYEESLADFTIAIDKQARIANPLPTPYFKRGYLLYLQQSYKEAVRDLSRAVELAPDMYEGYLYRANALLCLRRYDQAMRDYEELIRLKPDFALGYYGRALLLRERGDTVKAEADFVRAEKLGIKRVKEWRQ